MKTIQKAGIILILLAFTFKTKSQIAGSFSVPATFPTIAAAINTLNLLGVAGPVTIHISAGYTETATVGGYKLFTVPGASSSNQIFFQKNGLGANPLIYAYSGGTATPSSSVQDGVWWLIGADYVTIDGIDIIDQNTANPSTMEFGFGLYNNSPSDGCQHNTIKNCKVSLNRINSSAGTNLIVGGSRGIDVTGTSYLFNTISMTVSASSGAHSYNKFYNNVIENCHTGIALIQNNTTHLAKKNDIGGLSAATSNTILNFGGFAGSPSYGIRTLGQDSINLAFNVINNNNGNGSQPQSNLSAISTGSANTKICNVFSNTITISCQTPSVEVRGIYNVSGSNSSSVSISNNVFSSFTFSANSTFTLGGAMIQNAQSNGGTVSITGNYISNIHALSGSSRIITANIASLTTISNNTITNVNGYLANNNSIVVIDHGQNGPQIINNNLISNLSGPCPLYGMQSSKTASLLTISGNTLSNIQCAQFGGIIETGVRPSAYISDNLIYSYTTHSNAASGSFTGISIPDISSNATVTANRVYSISCSSGTGSLTGGVTGIEMDLRNSGILSHNKIGALYSSGPGSVKGILTDGGGYVFNNLIGDLRQTYANDPMAIAGITMLGASVKHLYYNTIYINETANSGSNFGSAALNVYGYSLVTARSNNNIFVNTSIATGTCATYASSLQSTVYYATSNNNLFYAGVPSPSNQVIKLGTNSYSTLAQYQLSSSSESLSVTELPPFTSTVVTDPDFLNINPSIPTQVESGGQPVTGYTLDYAGTVRNTTTPDIGAWEGNFTQADVFAPAIAGSGFLEPVCNSGGRTFTVNLTDASGVAGGTLSPRLYYRVNFTLYSNVQGVLSSGTATNGVWTFSLSYTANPSDVIHYFLAAQDISSFDNFTLYPSTGSTASDVNNVLIPPSPAFNFTIAGSPTVTVGSGTICSGQSFTLNPSGALSYTYTGGSAVVNPSTTTSFSVIGSDAQGCISANAAVATITVASPPLVSVNSGSICSGQSYTIQPSGADTYTISGGSYVINPLSNAFYTVTGTSTLNGCVSAAAVSTVEVFITPTIAVNSGTVCAGSSFTIAPTGAVSYSISGGSAVVSPLTNSVYLVSGSSSAGCVSSNTASASVFVAPLPTISVNSGSICSGKSFTILPAGADSYTYSGGLPVVSPLSNTSYSITGTSSLGCLSTNTAVASVSVEVSPTITVNSGTICAGQNFTIIPSNPLLTYTFSGGASVVSPPATSVYAVAGSNSLGCVSNSVTSNVLVYANPTISINSGSMCAGNSFTLVPSGAASYTISGNMYNVSPLSNTVYSVSGTSTAGCISVSSATAMVTVAPLPTISVSNGTICSGKSYTLTPSGASSYVYSGGSAIVSPLTNTFYTISGSSPEGCLSSNTATVSITVNASPTISVNSGSICSGQSFTIIPSDATLSYTYSGSSAVVSPNTNTLYTVAGTNSLGCISNTATSNVTVAASPSLTVNSGSICSGNTFTINPSGASTYTIAGGSGTVNPLTTTNYTVSGTSAEGCVSLNTATATVTVIALPTVSINNGTICSGSIFTLQASGADTYVYSSGSATVSPAITSTYAVSGSNSAGCASSNTAMATVTVYNLPAITITGNTTLCAADNATLLASGTAITYTWSTNTTGSLTSFIPVASTVIAVTGTDTNNCVYTATQTIHVNNLPLVTAQANTASVCSGNSITLSGGGAVTYSWTSGVINNNPFTPSATSNYTVYGTDANNCSNSASIQIVVNPLPLITIGSSSEEIICEGDEVILTANGANNYIWDSGQLTSTIAVSPAISNAYTVTGTDGNNCSNTAFFSQEVMECMGMNQLTLKEDVDIYPNPNSGTFVLEVKSLAGNSWFEIVSLLGEIVYTEKVHAINTRVELPGKAKGVYFVRFYRDRKLITQEKLVITE